MTPLDPAELSKAVRQGLPIRRELDGTGPGETAVLVKDLLAILDQAGARYLAEALVYVLRELVTNADKSVLKRVHFKRLGLDPAKPEDYSRGMGSFPAALRSRSDEYRGDPLLRTLRIRVRFHVSEGRISFDVTNLCALFPEEAERIRERLTRARAAQGLMDAWNHVSDHAEGAGIGLSMVVFMLRSIGADDHAVRILSEEGQDETTIRVTVPLDAVPQALGDTLSARIAAAVEAVPPMPENIRKLRELLDIDASFVRMAGIVQNDPGLTAALLKLVNGPLFLLPRRISNLTAACTLLGLRGLRTLLVSYGTERVIEARFGQQAALWEHSCLCASFARALAGILKLGALTEEAHVAGLLHDLGRLVLVEAHPDLTRSLENFSADHGIGGNLLERVALGTSHARVGALMALRWQFPAAIHAAIEFHHRPLAAPAAHRALCELVYLANLFCLRHTGMLEFEGVEPQVLAHHGIAGEKAFHAIGNRLSEQHRAQLNKSQEG